MSAKDIVPRTILTFPSPKEKKLANTLSELLQQAVEDAQALEKTKGFKLDMNIWTDISSSENKCYVCLGGSSMVRRLNAFDFMNLSSDDSLKIETINHLRIGEFKLAIENMCRTTDYRGPGVKGNCSCSCSQCSKSYRSKNVDIKPLQDLFRSLVSGTDRDFYDRTGRLRWGSYLGIIALMKEMGL